MLITEKIKSFAEEFNSLLDSYFPLPKTLDAKVIEAMQYSVKNGGKRLRPFMLYETAKMFGVDKMLAMRVGVALELLHSSSLIHDDLPAMDNDDLRRGKPTCHKAFDEATAILAGDGLMVYSFGLLSSDALQISPKIRCRLVNMLASAAGAFGGMIAGQMIDLSVEKGYVTKIDDKESVINRTEELKTGRLLRYACEAGAVLGEATEEQTQAIVDYSRKIGRSFQIVDDILDEIGDQKLVGKTLKKDAVQNKLTFVTMYGIDGAKKISDNLLQEAKDALNIFGDKADTLRELADYMGSRQY